MAASDHPAPALFSLEQLLAESAWLTALARALLHDSHEAEDVAQATRLAALEHAPADPVHARAWLVHVMRNFARRALRRRVRVERRERLAARPEALPSTEELVGHAQAQRRVVDALLELPEPGRSTLLLRYFHDLSAREIAARQGLPVETVRTRIKRALAQLRSRLDGEFGTRGAWVGCLLGAGGVTTMSVAGKWSAAVVVTAVAAIVAWRTLTLDMTPPGRERVEPSLAHLEPVSAEPQPESQPPAAPDTTPVRVAVPSAPAASEAESSLRIVALVLDARDEQPIEGATLTLRFSEAGTDQPESASAQSGADGRVVLVAKSVSPWGVGCEVRSPDHAPYASPDVPIDRAVDGTLDFGTVRLARGALVTGRVVRARDGAPIAGADLWLLREAPGQQLFGPARSRRVGSSGADGSFELTERAASPVEQALTLFAVAPAVADGIGWRSFEIVRGRERLDDVEIRVDPPAGLRVSVRDEAGAPIAGALVRAMPHFAPLGPASRFESNHAPWLGESARIVERFSCATDAEGVARFEGLPIGVADPLLAAVERGPFDVYDVVASQPGFDLTWSDRVQVSAAGPTECAIVMRATRAWSIVGHVRDADGRPIEGATVRELTRAARSLTDADGRWRIEGVDSSRGGIALDARADGHRRWQSWLAADVLTPATDATWSVEITLDRQARIAGCVVDDTGVPLAGAAVWLRPLVQDGLIDMSYRPDPPQTAADGRFAFTDANEEEWVITAFPPATEGEWHEPTTVHCFGGDEEVEVVIPRVEFGRARLHVEVVDATNGQPAEPSDVSLQPLFEPGRLTPIRIDRAVGRIEAWPLVPGEWRLVVKLTNQWRALRDFTVASPDDVVQLRLEVSPPASIAVDVAPATATAEVRWEPRHGTDGRAALDAGGRALVDGLVPGEEVRMWVAEGPLFDEAFITPTSGTTARVSLQPRPASFVRVTTSEPFPSGTLDFQLASNDGPWQSRALAPDPADPSAQLPQPLKPGHHRWRARFTPSHDAATTDPPPERPLVEGEFDVEAGATHALRIEGWR